MDFQSSTDHELAPPGWVRLENIRHWTERNHRSGKLHHCRTFTVAWSA